MIARLEPYRRHLLGVYLVVVTAVTLPPMPGVLETVDALPGLDKLIHVALFGGLAVLLYWNLAGRAGSNAALATVAAALAAAGLIELLQGPLPFRSGDVWDFAAGAAGALLGTAAASALLSGRGRAPLPSNPSEPD